MISYQVPYDMETEKTIIGTLLMEPDAILDSTVSPDDFYFESHQEVYRAMTSLMADNMPCDMVSVVNKMKEQDTLDKIGGASFIAKMTDVLPTSSAIPGYCRTIKDLALKRKLLQTATGLLEKCQGYGDAREIVDTFGQEFFTVTAEQGGGASPMSEIIPAVFSAIEQRTQSDGLAGIPTGFYGLDSLLSGLIPQDLIVLAGRPSMGKTALAVNNIGLSAAEAGHKVLVYSLEMGKQALGQRMLSAKARFNSNKLRNGLVADHEWPRLVQATGQLDKLPMTIDDSAGLSITEIRARAKRHAIRHGVDLIIVDYIQLASAKADSREREVAEISSGLKRLAKDLNVPVIALSQLNRSLEQRTDKRPKMSDLRDTGAIEQDADVIVFVYRDEVYNDSPDNPQRGLAELIVAKQRNGGTGTVKVGFIGEHTIFQDMPN